jgi:hypothetical protein
MIEGQDLNISLQDQQSEIVGFEGPTRWFRNLALARCDSNLSGPLQKTSRGNFLLHKSPNHQEQFFLGVMSRTGLPSVIDEPEFGD